MPEVFIDVYMRSSLYIASEIAKWRWTIMLWPWILLLYIKTLPHWRIYIYNTVILKLSVWTIMWKVIWISDRGHGRKPSDPGTLERKGKIKNVLERFMSNRSEKEKLIKKGIYKGMLCDMFI